MRSAKGLAVAEGYARSTGFTTARIARLNPLASPLYQVGSSVVIARRLSAVQSADRTAVTDDDRALAQGSVRR